MEDSQNNGTSPCKAPETEAHLSGTSPCEAHQVKYKTFFITWLSLLILTGLTIWVSGLELGNFSTFAAMTIATVKASLVLFIFMHLRYEPPIFRIMSFVTILTLTVIVLLTFTDVWFR